MSSGFKKRLGRLNYSRFRGSMELDSPALDLCLLAGGPAFSWVPWDLPSIPEVFLSSARAPEKPWPEIGITLLVRSPEQQKYSATRPRGPGFPSVLGNSQGYLLFNARPSPVPGRLTQSQCWSLGSGKTDRPITGLLQRLETMVGIFLDAFF